MYYYFIVFLYIASINLRKLEKKIIFLGIIHSVQENENCIIIEDLRLQ